MLGESTRLSVLDITCRVILIIDLSLPIQLIVDNSKNYIIHDHHRKSYYLRNPVEVVASHASRALLHLLI